MKIQNTVVETINLTDNPEWLRKYRAMEKGGILFALIYFLWIIWAFCVITALGAIIVALFYGFQYYNTPNFPPFAMGSIGILGIAAIIGVFSFGGTLILTRNLTSDYSSVEYRRHFHLADNHQ